MKQFFIDLETVMSVQSESYNSVRMETFIKRTLSNMELGYTTDKYGNIYVTKGNAELYPTMVCHIDTVHDINDNVVVMQIDDNMFALDKVKMQRYGIGGDDKVGIYITLSLLSTMENFKAVFFKDEEVGCIGSSKADHSFFDDSTIVLQCDRQRIGDFVNEISGRKLFDKELENDIIHTLEKYNRKVVSGGITDVGQIAEKNEVQVANMSCGYYDPHSDNEYIKVSEVESTKQMCWEILTKTKDKRYTIDLATRYTFPTYAWTGNYLGYGRESIHNHNFRRDDQYYNGNTWDNNDAWDNTPVFPKSEVIEQEPQFDHIKLEEPCIECDSEVWYDDYEEKYFCMGCHDYVDIPDNKATYDLEEQKLSMDEMLEVDDILWNAAYNKPIF